MKAAPAKILIVDDEPVNLITIVEYLQKCDEHYDIYQTKESEIAIKIAKKYIPDIIITDWNMPNISGIELINVLRKDNHLKDIPVIMCTGVMISSDDLKTAFAVGAFDYLRKPVDEIELRARTRSAIMFARKQKETLLLKERELTTAMLNLCARNEILKKIAIELQKCIAGEIDCKRTINEIITHINNNYLTQDDNDNFMMHFSKVHPYFSARLSELAPNLTPYEFKFCAYTRLNLNTKEIATILNIEPDSAKRSRMRIRKKLNIGSSTDLNAFLNNF